MARRPRWPLPFSPTGVWVLLRAALRAAAFLALTATLLLLFLALAPLGSRSRSLVRRAWCRTTCAILGLRLTRVGEPFTDCPTLLVANHVSYLDIPAIGAFAEGSFIAKSEVAAWPLFGLLAKLSDTMFIRRHWRQALLQRDQLAARLARGRSHILFGEGTSSNGLTVLPIKTSLLSVAEPGIVERPVAVQPVTIVFVQLADGTPVDAGNCDLYAWWGDALMLPHLLRVLRLDGVQVQVRFGEPVMSWAITSRKILGAELRRDLTRELTAARAPRSDEAGWPLPQPVG
jgi:1-acyl-sn-glycerol-3-phosphate acyltransferase